LEWGEKLVSDYPRLKDSLTCKAIALMVSMALYLLRMMFQDFLELNKDSAIQGTKPHSVP
jgi:hypothetical protein